MKDKKIVEIPAEDFENLIKRVKILEDELDKCEKINKYLNEEIKNYNKEFTDEKSKSKN